VRRVELHLAAQLQKRFQLQGLRTPARLTADAHSLAALDRQHSRHNQHLGLQALESPSHTKQPLSAVVMQQHFVPLL